MVYQIRRKNKILIIKNQIKRKKERGKKQPKKKKYLLERRLIFSVFCPS
jgi:hypothetical protein